MGELDGLGGLEVIDSLGGLGILGGLVVLDILGILGVLGILEKRLQTTLAIFSPFHLFTFSSFERNTCSFDTST